ncbi:MAG: hypothetical protein MJY92_07740 [Bacteroidales bacterium]|nr:hypothetical protein [Bacteroidales bacterium]
MRKTSRIFNTTVWAAIWGMCAALLFAPAFAYGQPHIEGQQSKAQKAAPDGSKPTIYMVEVPASEGCDTLTLPDDQDIVILNATAEKF